MEVSCESFGRGGKRSARFGVAQSLPHVVDAINSVDRPVENERGRIGWVLLGKWQPVEMSLDASGTDISAERLKSEASGFRISGVPVSLCTRTSRLAQCPWAIPDSQGPLMRNVCG